MKIWHLGTRANEYENLGWDSSISLKEKKTFDGRRKSDGWKPIRVKRLYDREFGNTLSLTPNLPVFDKEAVNILGNLINEFGEILPLSFVDGEFYAINVIEVLDCINYDEAEFDMYEDGSRIMCFNKYAFNESAVKGKHIFKIIDEPRRSPFVSDEFKERVLASGLTGFKFSLVWDSEA